MRKKLVFLLLATFFLLPWPVAYAYDQDFGEPAAVRVEVAETGSEPIWEVFGGAIGGLEQPRDLFYVDAGESPEIVPVNLYFTNAYELARSYRYLILKVGIYARDDSGQWQPAPGVGGGRLPDTYLTMRHGQVSFDLPGDVSYKITVDSGSFSSFPASVGAGDISPRFYLSVD